MVTHCCRSKGGKSVSMHFWYELAADSLMCVFTPSPYTVILTSPVTVSPPKCVSKTLNNDQSSVTPLRHITSLTLFRIIRKKGRQVDTYTQYPQTMSSTNTTHNHTHTHTHTNIIYNQQFFKKQFQRCFKFQTDQTTDPAQ